MGAFPLTRPTGRWGSAFGALVNAYEAGEHTVDIQYTESP